MCQKWFQLLIKCILYNIYSDAFAGNLSMATNNLPCYSLQNALNSLFLDSQLNYQFIKRTIENSMIPSPVPCELQDLTQV